MTYEIEGELEDPNTGEKLPFKAKFRIKDDMNEQRKESDNNGSELPAGG